MGRALRFLLIWPAMLFVVGSVFSEDIKFGDLTPAEQIEFRRQSMSAMAKKIMHLQKNPTDENKQQLLRLGVHPYSVYDKSNNKAPESGVKLVLASGTICCSDIFDEFFEPDTDFANEFADIVLNAAVEKERASDVVQFVTDTLFDCQPSMDEKTTQLLQYPDEWLDLEEPIKNCKAKKNRVLNVMGVENVGGLIESVSTKGGYFLYMLRDPRSVYLTLMESLLDFEGAANSLNGKVNEELARTCAAYRSLYDFIVANSPSGLFKFHRFAVVRYEDMANNPMKMVKMLKKMYGFLGTALPENVLDQISTMSKLERDAPVRHRDDESIRWKRELPLFSVNYVQDVCGDVMRMFGYIEATAESMEQTDQQMVGPVGSKIPSLLWFD